MPPSPDYQFEATAYIPKQSSSHKKHSTAPKSMSSSTASTASNFSTASTDMHSSSSFSTSPLFTSSTSSSSVPSFSTPSTRVYVTGRLSPTKLSSSHSAHSSPCSSLPLDLSSLSSSSSSSSSTSSSPSLVALNEIWLAYQHQRSLVTSLQSQLAHSQHALNTAKREYDDYKREVYTSISKLKDEFITAQVGYERALEGYRRGEREKEDELKRVKEAIRKYREKVRDEEGEGEERKVKVKDEEKEEDDEVGFEAEVKVIHRGKGRGRKSTEKCQCTDCEEEI